MSCTGWRHAARLRDAGAIVLGKTNVAQMPMFVETGNPLYGRTSNPWNINRSSGGSPGREGAILAAGGSYLGLGTDIGRLLYSIFSADGARLIKQVIRRDLVHASIKPILMPGARSPQMLLVLRVAGQPTLAGMTRHFGRTSAVDYWLLTAQQLNFRQRFAGAMKSTPGGPLGVILGLTCAVPPFPHGVTKDLGLAGANTLLYNVLDYPAGVVPVTRVRDGEVGVRPKSFDIVQMTGRACEIGSTGLPIGVQAASPWHEHAVLAAMRVVEMAARQSSEFPVSPPV